jgi:type I restriction enzyme R subunit
MSPFNEDSRVKIPALLHMTRLGYTYMSLKDAHWDQRNNIFPELLAEAALRINPELSRDDVPALLDELHLKLAGDDIGRSFHQRLTVRTGVRVIDFENLHNNSWHVVTEMPFENVEENFRPDNRGRAPSPRRS